MGIRLENLSNGKYCQKDTEFSGNNDGRIWTITGKNPEEEKVYTYDEAIDLAGNGWYNIGLLITLTLSVLAMVMDMFGFSYVVAAACDLQLSRQQTSLLLSVPLIGASISAYVHGYMSDTRGRMYCMNITLWASFVIASLSALAPNFTTLAVLKFFSSSLCSGIQSQAYTLMGESCGARTKDTYMLILNSSLVCGFSIFTVYSYIVLGLNFNIDLGFIVFKPWRLLILCFSMALGFSALLASFFYESPKFLVNAGKTTEALEILRKIKIRNLQGGNYPVKKIILVEESLAPRKNVTLLRSLWDQTVPLFRPPLLKTSIQLLYITAVIYSVNNGFALWFPVLTEAFFEQSSNGSTNITENFCYMINSNSANENSNGCHSKVSLEALLLFVVQGPIFLCINFGVSMLAHRKKLILICISVLASFGCFALTFITEKIFTIIFFFAIVTNCFMIGVTFCYFVELYPTCYRGMISCLGIMVARLSAMAGVNLVGAYTFTHCTTSLYIWGTFILSGGLVALLLPPDATKRP